MNKLIFVLTVLTELRQITSSCDPCADGYYCHVGLVWDSCALCTLEKNTCDRDQTDQCCGSLECIKDEDGWWGESVCTSSQIPIPMNLFQTNINMKFWWILSIAIIMTAFIFGTLCYCVGRWCKSVNLRKYELDKTYNSSEDKVLV
eukprot:UN05467